jgi:hypothetical protein
LKYLDLFAVPIYTTFSLYQIFGGPKKMKPEDDIHKRLDEICEKGEEITGKISQLSNPILEKKLKIMEELEINLNELLDYVKEWSDKNKTKD